MEEENILETIIDLGNSRVDFNIKQILLQKIFQMIDWKRMLKLLKLSKNVYCLNVLMKTK